MFINKLGSLMRILKTNNENPDKEVIEEAINVMAHGGVVLYPTDTVYGLGVNIFNKKFCLVIDNMSKLFKEFLGFVTLPILFWRMYVRFG